MTHPLLHPKFMGTDLYKDLSEFIDYPTYSNWKNLLTWGPAISNNIDKYRANKELTQEGKHKGLYRNPEFIEWVEKVEASVPIMPHDEHVPWR